MTARITIVTPSALGSNPRVVKEAEALARVGHEVCVVSTRALDFVDQRDDAVLQNASWTSQRLDLRALRAWRARRAVQLLARQAYGRLNLEALAPWAQSALMPLLTRELRRLPPADLYIAHYVEALPAAARLAARHGAAYAFDAEDFHLGDQPAGPESAIYQRLVRSIEGRYLPGALYVTAASPLIAQAYVEAYGIARPSVVLNVFPKANAPAAPSPLGSTEPGPSLYWFSQTIGTGRGLETAIRAIARAKSRPHLFLRGTPSSGYVARLREIAARCDVSGRLHVLNPALPDALERLAAGFDLGYSGETGLETNRLYALGNKLFSYLLGGLPCLASDIPAHRDLATELGPAIALFAVDDADALAALLDGFLLQPERLAQARTHAWQLGQSRFNWDVEQHRLLQTVEPALARRRAAQVR